MEEIEVPTESLQEEVQHHAAHGGGPQWTLGVALSSALLAALAAVTALLAGHHSNEAMIEQLQASDQWAYFQSKGIKSAVLSAKSEILQSLGREGDPKVDEKISEYKKEQEEIQKEAGEKERSSRDHLRRHLVFARGVTMFQVAIAIGAISVLTRRRRFWFVSMGFGAAGAFFLLRGLLNP